MTVIDEFVERKSTFDDPRVYEDVVIAFWNVSDVVDKDHPQLVRLVEMKFEITIFDYRGRN